jgi:hypothetical protein
MLKFGLILAAAMAVSSSAMADSGWSVKLMAPTREAEVDAAGVIWNCKVDVCTTLSDISDVDPPAACEGLTREVGAVASFGALPADKLAKCNRVAKHV